MPGSQVVLDGGAGDKEHTLPAWHSMVRARCFLSVANTTTYRLQPTLPPTGTPVLSSYLHVG